MTYEFELVKILVSDGFQILLLIYYEYTLHLAYIIIYYLLINLFTSI